MVRVKTLRGEFAEKGGMCWPPCFRPFSAIPAARWQIVHKTIKAVNIIFAFCQDNRALACHPQQPRELVVFLAFS